MYTLVKDVFNVILFDAGAVVGFASLGATI